MPSWMPGVRSWRLEVLVGLDLGPRALFLSFLFLPHQASFMFFCIFRPSLSQ